MISTAWMQEDKEMRRERQCEHRSRDHTLHTYSHGQESHQNSQIFISNYWCLTFRVGWGFLLSHYISFSERVMKEKFKKGKLDKNLPVLALVFYCPWECFRKLNSQSPSLLPHTDTLTCLIRKTHHLLKWNLAKHKENWLSLLSEFQWVTSQLAAPSLPTKEADGVSIP